jgi:hypothetical protein
MRLLISAAAINRLDTCPPVREHRTRMADELVLIRLWFSPRIITRLRPGDPPSPA